MDPPKVPSNPPPKPPKPSMAPPMPPSSKPPSRFGMVPPKPPPKPSIWPTPPATPVPASPPVLGTSVRKMVEAIQAKSALPVPKPRMMPPKPMPKMWQRPMAPTTEQQVPSKPSMLPKPVMVAPESSPKSSVGMDPAKAASSLMTSSPTEPQAISKQASSATSPRPMKPKPPPKPAHLCKLITQSGPASDQLEPRVTPTAQKAQETKTAPTGLTGEPEPPMEPSKLGSDPMIPSSPSKLGSDPMIPSSPSKPGSDPMIPSSPSVAQEPYSAPTVAAPPPAKGPTMAPALPELPPPIWRKTRPNSNPILSKVSSEGSEPRSASTGAPPAKEPTMVPRLPELPPPTWRKTKPGSDPMIPSSPSVAQEPYPASTGPPAKGSTMVAGSNPVVRSKVSLEAQEPCTPKTQGLTPSLAPISGAPPPPPPPPPLAAIIPKANNIKVKCRENSGLTPVSRDKPTAGTAPQSFLEELRSRLAKKLPQDEEVPDQDYSVVGKNEPGSIEAKLLAPLKPNLSSSMSAPSGPVNPGGPPPPKLGGPSGIPPPPPPPPPSFLLQQHAQLPSTKTTKANFAMEEKPSFLDELRERIQKMALNSESETLAPESSTSSLQLPPGGPTLPKSIKPKPILNPRSSAPSGPPPPPPPLPHFPPPPHKQTATSNFKRASVPGSKLVHTGAFNVNGGKPQLSFMEELAEKMAKKRMSAELPPPPLPPFPPRKKVTISIPTTNLDPRNDSQSSSSSPPYSSVPDNKEEEKPAEKEEVQVPLKVPKKKSAFRRFFGKK